MRRPGDFSDATIRLLGERVGLLCSKPDCRALTKGAHTDNARVAGVHEACHIHSASPDGPRYDASLTPEQCSAPENGIWLCRTHGRLIDSDPARFPAPLLRGWKTDAEREAADRIGNPRTPVPNAVVRRLATIAPGAVARLSYVPLGRRPGGMAHEIAIEWIGLDTESNVARLTCEIGGRRTSHSMPLGDIEEAWCADGTWTIRVSGYLHAVPLGPHRYVSESRETVPRVTPRGETDDNLTEGAADLMRFIRDEYVKAGFPNYKAWGFTPAEGDVRAAELRALDYLYFAGPRGGRWRLTEKGVSWIMANRENDQ